MVRVTRELDYFSAHIRLREPDKSKDKAEWAKGARKRRQVRRGSATQKVKCRLEMRWSEERHSVAEANLPIVKEGMQMQDNG
ncbi:hypothetical protein B296_00025948 [Ensete ventricosum]|uniref:Uncharacterized protein n=1 Tax=Ensete ventricosum TaxID=4639 RepID=A0A426YBQ5_ENSVE|nr:hypothetical protein B296_00025948 [Ensete ventricosum]